MSQAPRNPAPIPFRYPCPTISSSSEKNKNPSAPTAPMPVPSGGPMPNNMPMHPFMPPRMYNPYFGGYNMFQMPQMPPYPPYMPIMRNPQVNPSSPENSKLTKQQQERMMPPRPYFGRPMPPFYNPSMFMPPPYPMQLPPTMPPVDKEPVKKIVKASLTTATSEQKPVQKIQISNDKLSKKDLKSLQSSSSPTPIARQDSKPKTKEPKHADVKQYEPEGPKKKKKKQLMMADNYYQRETREKKESIEKLMDKLMRERPLRDRAIKIGKEHQAFIPQSFVNQFQYNLKIKLLKKQDLMKRLVPMRSA